MRKNVLVVFDEVVAGSIGAASPANDLVVYTDARFNDALAMFDKLAIHGIADQASVGTIKYVVKLEHSCDGRNWVEKGTLYDHSTAIATNTQVQDVGTDYTAPSCGLIRLAIRAYAPLSSTISFHLKLMACLRDEG
jgi:hypothetical protein